MLEEREQPASPRARTRRASARAGRTPAHAEIRYSKAIGRVSRKLQERRLAQTGFGDDETPASTDGGRSPEKGRSLLRATQQSGDGVPVSVCRARAVPGSRLLLPGPPLAIPALCAPGQAIQPQAQFLLLEDEERGRSKGLPALACPELSPPCRPGRGTEPGIDTRRECSFPGAEVEDGFSVLFLAAHGLMCRIVPGPQRSVFNQHLLEGSRRPSSARRGGSSGSLLSYPQQL